MKKIALSHKFIMCILASQGHIAQGYVQENFEKEFIEKIDAVSKNLEATEKNIQAQLKEFHDKFFNNPETQVNSYNNYAQNNIMPQHGVQHYQQTSSSLTLANQETSIKMTEQKDTQTTRYTIVVTDKKFDANSMQDNNNIVHDMHAELKTLESYINTKFKSQKALTILDACMQAITDKNKDHVRNMTSSIQDNQRTYSIEIAREKEAVAQVVTPKKKNRRNKK